MAEILYHIVVSAQVPVEGDLVLDLVWFQMTNAVCVLFVDELDSYDGVRCAQRDGLADAVCSSVSVGRVPDALKHLQRIRALSYGLGHDAKGKVRGQRRHLRLYSSLVSHISTTWDAVRLRRCWRRRRNAMGNATHVRRRPHCSGGRK